MGAMEQRRRGEFRFMPALQTALLLLFAVVLVTVACAPTFVIRYGIWLPAVAVVGLATYALALRFEEERNNRSRSEQAEPSTAKLQPAEEQKPAAALTEERKSNHYLLWAVAIAGMALLVIELWEVYSRMAIFVGFFLLFVIPRKDRSTVAKLFGLLALWAIPALWNGLKVAQFLILSVLHGIGPVWDGTIRVIVSRRFIRLSNGEEFHGVPFVLWGLCTLVILAILGVLWLRILNWFAKRLCPQMLFPIPP
jgi:hypothetical protein